ncbi:MAG: alpha/beta fold hydrolase [Geminicoccaceae bacterium]
MSDVRQPRSRKVSVPVGDAKIGLRILVWGEPKGKPPVVCVHGLTRNARDFDPLAVALSTERQVICPDVAGRGQSDWLADPDHYQVPVYASHLLALLAQLDLDEVDWVGTSMGGLIAMEIAASERSPIRRLVLNDVGPFVPYASLELIKHYLGLDLRFPDIEAIENHFRFIHAGFGDLTAEQWRNLAEHSSRPLSDGGYALAYDPLIREPFIAGVREDIDVWHLYDRITCPTLVLRGAESELLSAEVAQAMTERGPKAELVTFAEIGHAPALMDPEQIGVVRDFLVR